MIIFSSLAAVIYPIAKREDPIEPACQSTRPLAIVGVTSPLHSSTGQCIMKERPTSKDLNVGMAVCAAKETSGV
jgi:hypothetical protein